MARPCVYCGINMRPGKKGAHDQDRESIDHVFPTSGGVPDGKPFIWRQRNQVKVCRACNERKRALSPLLWLERMPEYGVTRLVERLLLLDVARSEINLFLARRRQRASAQGGVL